MRTVRAKHLPYTDGHLGKVAADMDVHGAPTIRCMEFAGELCALEGSHRLAVAHGRHVMPKLVIMEIDASGIPDGHWKAVYDTLPQYEFEHVLVLRLSDFM